MVRLLSVVLAVVMLFSLATIQSLAAEGRVVAETPGYNSDNSQPYMAPLTQQELLALRGDAVPIPPGTYTIGTGGTYTTLSAAVAALQSNGVAGGGTVVFEFINTSYSDSGQIIGGYLGQSVSNPVIFRPATGINAKITFTGGSTTIGGTFAVRMDSAVGITWDGSNSGGSDRSLTFYSDTATTVARTPVFIRKGSSFITLKNMIIQGMRHSTGGFGSVVVMDSTGNSAAGPQHDILVRNCWLMRGNNGIFQLGRSGALLDFNLTFEKNLIGGGTGAPLFDNLASNGVILVQASNNVLIDQNDINGIVVAGAGPVGISFRGANSNVTISRNKIHNLVTLSGAVRPLAFLVGNVLGIGPAVSTTADVVNNMIYDIHNFGTGSGGRSFDGVIYNPTGPPNSPNGNGSSVQFINNTFHILYGATEGVGNTNYILDGNFAGSNTTAGFVDQILWYNNICSSTRSASGLFSRFYLFFAPAAPGNLDFQADNNLYNQDAGVFAQVPDPWPTGAVNQFPADLAAWQAATSLDVNGKQADPLFVSSTDGHIDNTVFSPADSMAVPAGLAVDIDGDARSATVPDAGADEFTHVLSVDYSMLSITQIGAPPSPFRPASFARELTFPKSLNARAATPSVNRSKMLPRSESSVGIAPVTMKTAVQNIGGASPTYSVNWTFDGVSQASVAGSVIAPLGIDSVTLNVTPTARGTFTTTATAVTPGDINAGNDTRTQFHTLVYPDTTIRIRYDNGTPDAETNIGFNATSAVEAGVRFTASQNLKLANIDASYRNEANTDSVTVKVYAAGDDTMPGALLYTKRFGGANYRSAGGDYMTLPLGTDAPSFSSGSDFWVSILFAKPIAFPMGAQSVGITPGRSFISADSGASWSSVILNLPPLTEFAWLLRVVGVPAAPSTTTLNVGIAAGWNLISNPVTNPIPGDSVRQMYPTSLNAYAFEFSGGYVQRFKLANGKGYWEKFPGAISAPVTGTLRTRDSVSVVGGWNIVGSISNTVDTNTIVSVPAGLRASNWFGYTAGYTAVTQLVPGKGYWVKSTGVGKFVLANPLARPSSAQGSGVEISEVLNTLTITDSKGGSQTLYFGADGQKQIPVAMYTMPPAPPVGAFDARFETADGGSMVQTHGVELTTPVEFAVSVQSDAYPLTITWKVAHASYAISAAGSSKDMTGEGSMKIANSSVNRFSVKLTGDSQLPKEFALSQNYPNPFNPTTSIKYALPVDSKVTMEIYNVLGQRVATLLNEVLPAGYHAIEWNSTGTSGQQLGSGVYFLQLSAEGSGKKFSEIRKLMLLK